MATSDSCDTRAHTKTVVEKCSLLWDIESFSQLGHEQPLNSPVFHAVNGTFSWKLLLWPKGVKTDYFSTACIKVALELTSEITSKPLNCSYTFLIMDSEENELASKSGNTQKFSNNPFGHTDLIEKDELLQKLTDDKLPPTNDTIKIRVNVVATVSVTTIPRPPVKMASIATTILYETKKLSDFAIRVQEECMQVHKCVLACKSTAFEAMMNNDTKEVQLGVVDMTDIEMTTVQAMVEFFYLGKVSKLDLQLAKNLLKVADKYFVTDLREYCSEYLKENMDYSNVIDILMAASNSNASELKEACLNYMFEKRSFKLDDEQKEDLKQQTDLLMEYFCKQK